MRGANAYQSLHQSHQALESESVVPGPRYEAVRDTLRELDARQSSEGPTRPEFDRAIDTAEAKRSALDRELAEMRAAGPAPGRQAEVEPVGPKEWTESGGMVEQQHFAQKWLKQNLDEQSKGSSREPAPAGELTQEDRDLLYAARTTEGQTQQHEPGRSRTHEFEHFGP
jgi:hypothetical protein